MEEKTTIAVVGGGPAGYTAAIRASQLGARVILIENRELGGACLNRACVPAKFLLRSVEMYQLIKDSARYGIGVAETVIDMAYVDQNCFQSSQPLIVPAKTFLSQLV